MRAEATPDERLATLDLKHGYQVTFSGGRPRPDPVDLWPHQRLILRAYKAWQRFLVRLSWRWECVRSWRTVHVVIPYEDYCDQDVMAFYKRRDAINELGGYGGERMLSVRVRFRQRPSQPREGLGGVGTVDCIGRGEKTP